MSKIVTVPNPDLRRKSQEIKDLDKRTLRILQDLESTLTKQKNPAGVGLALPQIGYNLQAFATLLPDKNDRLCYRVFINPTPTAFSKEKITRAPEDKEDVLEGCLSIPSLYAPIPRHLSIDFHYFTLENGKLVEKSNTFTNYEARVMQHEYDHLMGVLFTDYLLDNDLPIFLGKKNEKLTEIDKNIIKSF